MTPVSHEHGLFPDVPCAACRIPLLDHSRPSLTRLTAPETSLTARTLTLTHPHSFSGQVSHSSTLTSHMAGVCSNLKALELQAPAVRALDLRGCGQLCSLSVQVRLLVVHVTYACT